MITVTSQAELDAVPDDFEGAINIRLCGPHNPVSLKRCFPRAAVVLMGNSHAELMGNSHAVLWDNSHAELMDNSQAVLWGNSHAVLRDNSHAEAGGNSQVYDRSAGHNVSISGNARIVCSPKAPEEYLSHCGVEPVEGKARLYKAVHKVDGRLVSDYDRKFEYIIGETAVADWLDTDVHEDCGHGIHVAHKAWCVDFGRMWDDLSIIEVEVDVAGIVVSMGANGKVRTASVKVLREVPLEECGLLGKMLAEKRRCKDV